jgi:putative tryptophan/tyrosine transport system substrate-binding protein
MQFDQLKRRQFISLLGGAAVMWPLVARAQQPAKETTMPVIGFMSARSPEESGHLVDMFRRGLKEGGFVEGQNVRIEFRWAHGDYDRLPALAADLVARNVAVITAVGGDPSPIAAKQATVAIPIAFTVGGDPVGAGLVESFNRPGGNMTGVTLRGATLMEPKRLGLLHDLAPNVALVGALTNPSFPAAANQAQDIEVAARAIGQRVVVATANNDDELEAAFASLGSAGIGALLVAGSPYFDTRRDRIIAFAARQRLPALYPFREYAIAGGVLSYGVSITDAYRQVGLYTARILKGTKPAELPVQQVDRFELIINLRTAKALGIAISDNLLSLADEVIE